MTFPGMTKGRAWLVGIPAGLLVVCLVASYLTRGAMANLAFLKSHNGAAQDSGLVDQRPWQTVAALAPLAVSAEEQEARTTRSGWRTMRSTRRLLWRYARRRWRRGC